MGLIVGKLQNTGERFLANHGDEGTLIQLASTEREQIGQSGNVHVGEDGRHLFVFDAKTRL